jgi:hypothetical protein
MRVRLSALLLAALAGSFSVALIGPTAHAAVNLAQETGDDEGEITETDEEQADTQPGGEAPAEEEGPPWTYQMARIGIVLMLLVGGLIGLMYYRMIVQRQKGGI